MTELYLCHRGYHEERWGLAASSLGAFAEFFPNLVELGVFIQPVTEPPPQPYSTQNPSAATRVFQNNFRVLDAGDSAILVEHVAAMAEFLIALSPPNPFFVEFSTDIHPNFEPQFTGWRGVRDAYVTGINIRCAVGQNARHWYDLLLAENAELRAKISLLEEYIPFELASQGRFREGFQALVSALSENLRRTGRLEAAAEPGTEPPNQDSV
ncbi:hypothetical protein FRC01_014447 [Tulasnella sp. 417]|nr:hypothetical protein FRC01_014447 [Tulasnella sp. 417]